MSSEFARTSSRHPWTCHQWHRRMIWHNIFYIETKPDRVHHFVLSSCSNLSSKSTLQCLKIWLPHLYSYSHIVFNSWWSRIATSQRPPSATDLHLYLNSIASGIIFKTLSIQFLIAVFEPHMMTRAVGGSQQSWLILNESSLSYIVFRVFVISLTDTRFWLLCDIHVYLMSRKVCQYFDTFTCFRRKSFPFYLFLSFLVTSIRRLWIFVSSSSDTWIADFRFDTADALELCSFLQKFVSSFLFR